MSTQTNETRSPDVPFSHGGPRSHPATPAESTALDDQERTLTDREVREAQAEAQTRDEHAASRRVGHNTKAISAAHAPEVA